MSLSSSSSSLSKSRPIFVVVPGATQTPSHYAYLIHLIQSQGYGTLTAMLPSVGASSPVSIEEDVAYIRTRMLLPILDVEKHDVIMIMHSYSGMPGSAAARGLGKADREAQGKNTSVLGQIFVATVLAHGGDGKDIIGNIGGQWPTHISIYGPEDRIKCDEPREPLYKDVPQNLAIAAESSSISHSLTSFQSPCPPTSWDTAAFQGRCAYVRAVRDEAVPYEIQSMMLRGGGTGHFIIRDIETGHSPQLAAPERLRDIILELAQQFVCADDTAATVSDDETLREVENHENEKGQGVVELSDVQQVKHKHSPRALEKGMRGLLSRMLRSV